MKSIAIIFSRVPHGSTTGREGLDAVLAMSALTDQIGLFFVADGVFQLLPEQQPERILARNYIATFGVLSLYDIQQCYVCQHSLEERGISADHALILPADKLDVVAFRQRLAAYETILTF